MISLFSRRYFNAGYMVPGVNLPYFLFPIISANSSPHRLFLLIKFLI